MLELGRPGSTNLVLVLGGFGIETRQELGGQLGALRLRKCQRPVADRVDQHVAIVTADLRARQAWFERLACGQTISAMASA